MNTIFPLLYSSILLISLTLICFYLGGLLKMTQAVEKRISILETRLQTDERSADNFYKLGQIYLRKKIYDKAINLFRQSLKYWDENDKIGLGSLYNTLGFTYFKLKEYDQAIYYYTQAIKLLPDYTLALTNLGLVYENKQMYKEASKAYFDVLRYEDENKIAKTRFPMMQIKAELRN
jgi:tetratricopeptide (TPR) repeat protein